VRETAKINSFLKGVNTAIRTGYKYVIVFGLLALILIIVYGNDFSVLANEASNDEALTHILLMPFLSGFLFYLRRDAVKAAVASTRLKKKTRGKFIDEIVGIILCIVAFLLYIYGSNTFYPLEYHIASLPIFIAGITIILLNPQALKLLAFPILFLFFLIPVPAIIINPIGGALASINTQASYTVMHTLGLPVTLSYDYGAPAILLSNQAGQPMTFAVDLACSGLYSLTAFAMFATFLVILASASILKKSLLFVVGFLLFTGLNIVRLITIVSVGYWVNEETALLVHSFMGFVLIFAGMLMLIGLAEKILKIRIITKIEEKASCSLCKSNSAIDQFCQNCGKYFSKAKLPIFKATFLKLTVIVFACSIAVLLFAPPTFATTQGSVQISSSSDWENAENVFPKLQNYTLNFLYEDTEYEELTKQDVALVYGYFPNNVSRSVIYTTLSISSSLSKLHDWESCFITYPVRQGQAPIVNVRASKDVQLIDDPKLVAKYLVFDSPQYYRVQYTQANVYWYERVIFATESGLEQKYVRINLIILTQNPENLDQFENELVDAGQTIASSWQRLKTQSLMSLGVPALQLLLACLIGSLILTMTTQYFTERKRIMKNLKAFQKFESPKEKIVLEALIKLAKSKKSVTTDDINGEIKKQPVKAISRKETIAVLSNLEESGFIKKIIITEGNAPVLVWKLDHVPKY
jgi:exosortase